MAGARQGNPKVPNRVERIRRHAADTDIQRKAVAAMPKKPPKNPLRALRAELGMTQREFAAAIGSKQSNISPAETGIVRHPALLLERIKAAGLLPPEREEQFLKDWARWLRWIDSRKGTRADIARFVDELAEDQLGPCLKLIGERLTRITLDPVGPYAL